MKNKIELVCEICSTTFKREKREHKRSQKLGRKTYCSRSCSGKGNIKNIPKESRGNTEHLRKGSQRDDFSQFRYHLRKAKSRNKTCTLTLQDLKYTWDSQSGICAYTGIKLKDWSHKSSSNSFYTASLDRIDSNKGYIKENIQFVSRNVNFMKNNLLHDETIELCKIIANYWK